MTREEAKRILYVYRAVNLVDASHREAFDMAIKALEQEPIGHWILHDKHRECSRCNVWLPKDMPRNSYCPNCGARMEVEE